MDQIDTLLQELEGAEEGSRDLGYAVSLATGWKHVESAFGPVLHLEKCSGQAKDCNCVWRNPTLSVDAALSLVPEGWSIAGLWEAVNPKDRPWWGVNLRRDDPYKVLTAQGSPAPALALCIAAIKARRGAA